MIFLFVKSVYLINQFFDLSFVIFKFFIIFSKKFPFLEINRF